jgi:SAM-dependent methyltransferase
VNIADDRPSVAAIYEEPSIAEGYLDKRMQFAWQRLLHRKQVGLLNAVIRQSRPEHVLEVAPGPARLSVELEGVRRGIMVENSQEMLNIAGRRLRESSLADIWETRKGDAFALGQAIEPATMQLAFTFRFLRHFHTAERERLYAQLRHCLAPRGLLVFDVVGAELLRRIEARMPQRPAGEIPIYDVSYTLPEFEAEMRRNGFALKKAVPVLRQFSIQSHLSYAHAHRAQGMIDAAVRLLELVPSSAPLEWVAVCEKL